MATQTIENRLKKLERTEAGSRARGVYIYNPEKEISEEILASGKYIISLRTTAGM